jgi:SpoVK/Ycf46/Vps4 family AAA+-type ATPase
MQERQGEAFVIATSNDVEALPPELLRKGRFDELFFVDLPNPEERVAIAHAALRSHGRDGAALAEAHAPLRLAEATDGFTGSEIAALVPDALFAAFADDGREITASDLLAAAKTVVPLSKTAAEKIARLRDWAKGRARPANGAYAEQARAAGGRQIDL